MATQNYIGCEGSSCERAAVARVSFAHRISKPEVLPIVHELNLCSSHIAEVEQHFKMVTVEMITTPEDHTQPMSARA